MAGMVIDVDGRRYDVDVVFDAYDLQFVLTVSGGEKRVQASGEDMREACRRLVDNIREEVYQQRGDTW